MSLRNPPAGITTVVESTQASYDALATKDASTLYLLTGTGATTAVRANLGVKRVWGPPRLDFAGVATWTSTSQQVTDEMTLAAWAGAEFVRVDLYWYLIEQSQGVYDWSLPDARFDAADAAGLRVLWVVGQSPAWSRTGGEPSEAYPPTNVANYGSFVTAAVNRYKARGTLGAHHWEIWNEVNTDWHFGDPTQYAKYVACLQAAYTAAKSADSTAQILIGGLLRGGRDDDQYQCVTDDYWLTNFYAAGGGPYFDIFSYHTYCYPMDPADTSSPDHTNGASVEHGWQGVALMQAVLASRGDSKKPFWVTEWGQHTGTEVNAVSAANQALFLEHAVTRAKTALVDRVFVFGLRDAGTDVTLREHNFGVVDAAFGLKPSFRSFRKMAARGHGQPDSTITTGTAATHIITVDSGLSFAATKTSPIVTGSLVGDILVAFAQANDQATTVSPGDTGWTLRGNATIDNGRILVFTKVAVGTQGTVVWTYSGSHNHRVSVSCWRGGTEPTTIIGNTARTVSTTLSNTLLGKAGAVFLACGYASQFASVPAWDATLTVRFTNNIAVGGNAVASQSFTDSDAWTGEKTFTPGNGGSSALICAAGVVI